ncbi:MAG: hypothetical protein FWE62_03050 [Firmicutes bacterium]|nr:hypothetical protein [Bacillota bacterium]
MTDILIYDLFFDASAVTALAASSGGGRGVVYFLTDSEPRADIEGEARSDKNGIAIGRSEFTPTSAAHAGGRVLTAVFREFSPPCKFSLIGLFPPVIKGLKRPALKTVAGDYTDAPGAPPKPIRRAVVTEIRTRSTPRGMLLNAFGEGAALSLCKKEAAYEACAVFNGKKYLFNSINSVVEYDESASALNLRVSSPPYAVTAQKKFAGLRVFRAGGACIRYSCLGGIDAQFFIRGERVADVNLSCTFLSASGEVAEAKETITEGVFSTAQHAETVRNDELTKT